MQPVSPKSDAFSDFKPSSQVTPLPLIHNNYVASAAVQKENIILDKLTTILQSLEPGAELKDPLPLPKTEQFVSPRSVVPKSFRDIMSSKSVL